MGLKLSSFEESVWNILTPILAVDDAVITPSHPKTLTDLRQCKAHVVLSYLSDPVEGVIISQIILQPTYSFVVYSGEYIVTKKLQERIIEIFCEEVKAYDFNTPDIRVNTISKIRRSPVVYANSSEMYSAGVDYRFFINAC